MGDVITVEPIRTDVVEVAVRESAQTLESIDTKREIKTQGEYVFVCGVRRKAKVEIKKLNAERKDMTKGIDSTKKKIMALFQRPIGVYEEVVTICDKGMLSWDTKQEEIRKAQQEKLNRQAEAERKKKEEQERAWREKEEAKRAEAEALKAEGKLEEARKAQAEADKAAEKAEERQEAANGVIAPVIGPSVDKVEGTSYRTDWYGEVEDIKVLMKAILDGQAASNLVIADESAINKVARATKGTIVIPGVVIKSKKIPVSRG